MIDEILDGKYRIERQLGAGGMGNVYLATHLWTTRQVAVKVIAPKWAAEPQFLARFQREAQACGRLRHPNIVNVTDFGIAKTQSGDVPYLVMEFLNGQTLSDFQETDNSVSLPLVADLLDQIGLALQEAHRNGIVHRDLKPDNVWLEPNGRGGYTAKVLDFGVAKVNLLSDLEPPIPHESLAIAASSETEQGTNADRSTDETETIAIRPESVSSSSGSFDRSDSAKTMPGSLLGTPAYMSPEQALGKEVDFRSDIYSLAVLAYSLTCGRLPFKGTTTELFEYHLKGAPIPPASVRNIPADVSNVILAGLAREPSDRPESAVAFTRRYRNAVDAEFLALRRSRAFLLRHLGTYVLLIVPGYGALVGLVAIIAVFSKTLMPTAAVRAVLLPLVVAALLVFSDNVLRASAALIALDERVRVRRILVFRVFWKLLKKLPVLAKTQVEAVFLAGPNWVIGDCLWPVVCVVEKLSGKVAIQRSRELMTGLRSAGRALAIRHFAVAVFAIADVLKSLSFLWRNGDIKQPNVVISTLWFPLFALFAAAPLFLYDRTVGDEQGPLLQLDRTPEVRLTARALSWSSLFWLLAAIIELFYTPLKIWLWP